MTVREIRVWVTRCDSCGNEGPVSFSDYAPTIPSDWSARVAHDCGLTGFSATRIYCPDCTQKRAASEAS